MTSVVKPVKRVRCFGPLRDVHFASIHLVRRIIRVFGERRFRWYLAKYIERTRDDEIHRFAADIGADEERLRRLIARRPNEKTINAYGDLDELKKTMDMARAKHFLESLAGRTLSPFALRMQADKQLRAFVLTGRPAAPQRKAAEAPEPYGK